MAGNRIFTDVTHSLGAYLKATLQNALIVTGLYIAGLAIAGGTWWFAAGLLAGLLNAVPNFGPILALGLLMAVEFFATEGWITMAYAGLVWLVIQVIDGFFLGPRAAGRSGISPLWSIALVILGGLVAGPIGMMLAVPLAAILLIVLRALRPKRRSGAPAAS